MSLNSHFKKKYLTNNKPDYIFEIVLLGKGVLLRPLKVLRGFLLSSSWAQKSDLLYRVKEIGFFYAI